MIVHMLKGITLERIHGMRLNDAGLICLRLENEHLNNAGKFRAVKSVPLPFHEVDDQD